MVSHLDNQDQRPCTPLPIALRNIAGPLLRRLIERALPLDEDVDAFSIDYFPEIKRSFGLFMNRQMKLNRLLELSPPQPLLAALVAQVGEAAFFAILQDLTSVAATQAARVRPDGSPVRRSRARARFFCIAAGLLVGVTGVSFSNRIKSPSQFSIKSFVYSNSGSTIIDSQPSGSTVKQIASGRVLGVTPWRVDSNHSYGHICIMHDRYESAIIRHREIRFHSLFGLPLLSRLKPDDGSSTTTRTEECDAPTIID